MAETARELLRCCRDLDVSTYGESLIDTLARRVEAVLALHQPFVLIGHETRGQFCAHCSHAPWPCPTVRLLGESE